MWRKNKREKQLYIIGVGIRSFQVVNVVVVVVVAVFVLFFHFFFYIYLYLSIFVSIYRSLLSFSYLFCHLTISLFFVSCSIDIFAKHDHQKWNGVDRESERWVGDMEKGDWGTVCVCMCVRRSAKCIIIQITPRFCLSDCARN